MADRPYVVLSAAISLDGYLDDASEQRLVLSGPADLDRVDALRATCDAILVGAETVRRDDPRLLVRDPARRSARVARGLPASPAKVTVTRSGRLDPGAAFFTAGDTDRVVYCGDDAVAGCVARLGASAGVVGCGEPPDLGRVLADLRARGVARLLVEGGGTVHTQLLQAGVVDELRLAVAPLFVGDARATRFVGDGPFSWNADRRAVLAGVDRVDDVGVLRYILSEQDVPAEPEEDQR